MFDVKDQWAFVVARPAAINNAAGYPAAHVGAMTIDGYVGVVNVGEIFVIKSENINHIVTRSRRRTAYHFNHRSGDSVAIGLGGIEFHRAGGVRAGQRFTLFL